MSKVKLFVPTVGRPGWTWPAWRKSTVQREGAGRKGSIFDIGGVSTDKNGVPAAKEKAVRRTLNGGNGAVPDGDEQRPRTSVTTSPSDTVRLDRVLAGLGIGVDRIRLRSTWCRRRSSRDRSAAAPSGSAEPALEKLTVRGAAPSVGVAETTAVGGWLSGMNRMRRILLMPDLPCRIGVSQIHVVQRAVRPLGQIDDVAVRTIRQHHRSVRS